MGLRERDRTAPGAASRAPAPRTGGLRQVLALAVALAAVIGFAALVRPQPSSSARLRIGESEDPADAPGRQDPADEPGRGGDAAEVPSPSLVRSRRLDPATLEDVATTVLAVPRDAFSMIPSDDGTLLAVPGREIAEGSVVVVVEAQTLQPVASLSVAEPVDGRLTFAPERDAVLVGGHGLGHLTRHPFDPGEPTTRVDLPADVAIQGPWTPLGGGRAAALATSRSPSDPQGRTGMARVLVADLLAERVVVDLPLPGLPPGLFVGDVVEAGIGAFTYVPATAWDVARERLYVVAGDVARITAVDLAGGVVLTEAAVASQNPQRAGEPLHRRWHAMVSPNGFRLYVGGWARNAGSPDSGWGDTIGLSVIDTATLTEVGDIAEVSEWFTLSPDGRWLSWMEQVPPADGAPGEARARLLDARELQPAPLPGNRSRSSSVLGFSGDSAHFYLVTEYGSARVLRAYDLATMEPSGQRRLYRESWFEPLTGLLHEAG